MPAGAGEKRAPAVATVVPSPPALQPGTLPGIPPLLSIVNLAGSDIYLIPPDGSPKKLWSSHEDVVYALAFDSAGRLMAGTGNRGRIYAIEKDGTFADLLKATANHVTAFRKAPGGGLYCASSNLGKIFLVGSRPEAEGTFESDAQDAHVFSRWGRAEVRGWGTFELFARSGNVDNPDRNWSPWSSIDLRKDAQLQVPSARFVQWRAVLKPANPPTRLEEVAINYLPKNVAPVVDEVFVQVGARFNLQPRISAPETVIVGPPSPQPASHVDVPPGAARDRAYIAVRWTAHDENDDELVYSLYYRGAGEQDWKLLKAGLTDKFHSFESALLPDGSYTVKVTASDAPSHTPPDALAAEKQSQLFEVDNTAPRIEGLTAKVDGGQLRVTFHASDDSSPIKRAEYSVDAGEWQYVGPVGEISDSKTESYDFNAPLPEPPRSSKSKAPVSEHVVVVRVYDRYDNVATAKYVVR
ncbi:MAG TPA: fibronectin type III domain-containing protein [Verrucomicrobiae bacterium]|jgi:hypothetical protein|nr:fibronectin type III domain-containing protein [Verrucomicrobiae bacterium]